MLNRIGPMLMCLCSVVVCLAAVVPEGRADDMQYPISAAVAKDGTIYVADIDAPGVWKIKDGKVEKFFAGSKKYRTPLNRPRCLAVDADGKLLVGDPATREVYRFDEPGKPVPLTKGGIGIPRAIVVLPKGDLLVADQELKRIWKVPATGGVPEKFVDVPGLIAVCRDKDGDLWAITSPEHDLRKITSDGKIENVITRGPFQFRQEVAVDDAKTVYISDNYAKAIWKVPLGKKPVKLAEGAPLVGPTGVIWTGEKLIVTDPRAKAVFEIDADGKVTKIAPAL